MQRFERQTSTSWRWPVAVIAFVVTPIGLAAYSLALGGGRVGGYTIDTSVNQVVLATLALGELGVLGVLGWSKQLRIAPLAAIIGLVVTPWLFGIVPGESKAATGYVLLLFAVVLIVTGIEVIVRYSDQLHSLLHSKTGRYAIAFGILHSALGFALESFTRTFSWLIVPMFPVSIASVLGLFLAGATPVVLWSRNRLATPAILVVSWFLWSVYGTWTMRDALPWGSFSAIDWSGIRPYPDYLMTWTVLLVGLVFVAGCELGARRLGTRLAFKRNTTT